MKIPVTNGHKLILINSHMSAYDKGGKMRVKQLRLLNSVMESEYKKGNYVIVGGDMEFTTFITVTTRVFHTPTMEISLAIFLFDGNVIFIKSVLLL